MRKLYVNGKKEDNLRKNVGKKFNKRVARQRKKRASAKKSDKENEIASFLIKEKIVFVSEYSPEGLVNPITFHPLYLDFFLPDFNAAIEYDGVQHYKPIHGKKQLRDYIERDRIKTLYCRYKAIKLLRIPYTCLDIQNALMVFISNLNTN